MVFMAPETSELIPPPDSPVIYQHDAISESIYSMSINARRLIAMAMRYLRFEDVEGPPNSPRAYKNMPVEFTVGEFMKGMGIKRGTHSDATVLEAVRECLKATIEIRMPNGNWKGWTWFSASELIRDGVETKGEDSPVSAFDKICMKFNQELNDALKLFQFRYSAIIWENFGKLQSMYAVKLYELAMKNLYLAGKQGQKTGEWYFPSKPYSVAELRRLLSVEKAKYKETHNFRRKCIDYPCEEIRETNIGIEIEPQYVKRGKYLIGIWFKCQVTHPGERNVTPIAEDHDEAEMENALIAAYPDEYQRHYDFDMKQQELFNVPFGKELHARHYAIEKLKEAHPDFISNWRKNHGGKK